MIDRSSRIKAETLQNATRTTLAMHEFATRTGKVEEKWALANL
jgi:hypothetical protein